MINILFEETKKWKWNKKSKKGEPIVSYFNGVEEDDCY